MDQSKGWGDSGPANHNLDALAGRDSLGMSPARPHDVTEAIVAELSDFHRWLTTDGHAAESGYAFRYEAAVKELNRRIVSYQGAGS